MESGELLIALAEDRDPRGTVPAARHEVEWQLRLDARTRLDDEQPVGGEHRREPLGELRLQARPRLVRWVAENEVVSAPARPLLAQDGERVPPRHDRARQL